MGRRANLFYAARDCINVLQCPKPNDILYEYDLGLCMIFLVRQKLMNVAHKIINDIYKRNKYNISDLLRFYKLNKLHVFQLKKYNDIDIDIDMNTNVQYLQKISYMITMCSKCVK
jgi:hypothetical protein